MVTKDVFPFQGKTHMLEPGIEPGTSWLVVSSSDHQATRLVTYVNVSRPEKKRGSCLLAAGQKLQIWNFSPHFKKFTYFFYDFSLNSGCETLSSDARDAENLPNVCTVVQLSAQLQTCTSVKRLDVASLPGPRLQGELHVNMNVITGVRIARG